MTAILKMNLKLLLRNKGFLFFLLITPLVSSIILGQKVKNDIYANKSDESKIIELDDCASKAVYKGDTSACIIKVYDGCGEELSEYMLNRLAQMGMFSVCRSDVSGMSDSEVLDRAKKDAFDDRMGAILYIKPDFEQAVMEGAWKNSAVIYDVSSDERKHMFENEWEQLMKLGQQALQVSDKDSEKALQLLEAMDGQLPVKKVVTLAGKEKAALTDRQIDQKTCIGYAFAIITLGFLFCGVFVAHTVIEEQNNKVYIRVLMSKVGSTQYYLSKVVLTVLISFMQSLVLAGCLLVRPDIDMGMNKLVFMLVIFMLGLIFSTLSLLLGTIIGDVMSSNYAVFAVWSISALLAGLYFPLDDTSGTLKLIANLMPQRWFMKVSELLMVNDHSAYPMLLYVTAAYLIVIISIGSIGLKMKRGEG